MKRIKDLKLSDLKKNGKSYSLDIKVDNKLKIFLFVLKVDDKENETWDSYLDIKTELEYCNNVSTLCESKSNKTPEEALESIVKEYYKTLGMLHEL